MRLQKCNYLFPIMEEVNALSVIQFSWYSGGKLPLKMQWNQCYSSGKADTLVSAEYLVKTVVITTGLRWTQLEFAYVCICSYMEIFKRSIHAGSLEFTPVKSKPLYTISIYRYIAENSNITFTNINELDSLGGRPPISHQLFLT